MQLKFLAHTILLLWFASYSFSEPDVGNASCFLKQSDSADRAYVQVTSVTVEPAILHKQREPKAVTVIAQILLRGHVSANPEAIVEVGTSSSDPPNNELKYENPTRNVPLHEGVTVVKFKAESAPKTFQGKIKVAVTLGGATNGINVKDSEPKDYIAELTVLDP